MSVKVKFEWLKLIQPYSFDRPVIDTDLLLKLVEDKSRPFVVRGQRKKEGRT